MALVAYDSSEFSDSEEEDKEFASAELPSARHNVGLKDSSSAAVSKELQADFELLNKKSSEIEDHEDSSINKTTLFASLPTPRSTVQSALPEEEEEDEFLKVAPRLALAGSVITKSKGNEPVKITIPCLAELSDDDEASVKRPRPTGGGLFAMLPPPKHEAVKITNRPLVPHSVGKKKATDELKQRTKTAIITTEPRSFASRGDESDGDDDDAHDGSLDFFSLDFVGKTDVINLPTNSEETLTPLNEQQVSSYSVNQCDVPLELSDPWNVAGATMPASLAEDSAIDVSQEPCTSGDAIQTMASDQTPDLGSLTSLFADEGFLRLHGKKRRGKEDIEIIDVSQDEQLPKTEEWLTKLITQESEYRPARKKGFMPTAQQRRKHQITYLAFQAKERELELKNQWSQNRFTRRQTQSKYGF